MEKMHKICKIILIHCNIIFYWKILVLNIDFNRRITGSPEYSSVLRPETNNKHASTKFFLNNINIIQLHMGTTMFMCIRMRSTRYNFYIYGHM